MSVDPRLSPLWHAYRRAAVVRADHVSSGSHSEECQCEWDEVDAIAEYVQAASGVSPLPPLHLKSDLASELIDVIRVALDVSDEAAEGVLAAIATRIQGATLRDAAEMASAARFGDCETAEDAAAVVVQTLRLAADDLSNGA